MLAYAFVNAVSFLFEYDTHGNKVSVSGDNDMRCREVIPGQNCTAGCGQFIGSDADPGQVDVHHDS